MDTGKYETCNKKIDEFHKICEPLVKYMQDNPKDFSIHSTIIITVDGAKLVTDEMMTHYDLPEGY